MKMYVNQSSGTSDGIDQSSGLGSVAGRTEERSTTLPIESQMTDYYYFFVPTIRSNARVRNLVQSEGEKMTT